MCSSRSSCCSLYECLEGSGRLETILDGGNASFLILVSWQQQNPRGHTCNHHWLWRHLPGQLRSSNGLRCSLLSKLRRRWRVQARSHCGRNMLGEQVPSLCLPIRVARRGNGVLLRVSHWSPPAAAGIGHRASYHSPYNAWWSKHSSVLKISPARGWACSLVRRIDWTSRHRIRTDICQMPCPANQQGMGETGGKRRTS